jgi:hypothetical protein
MSATSAADNLALARKHLARVQESWSPPEWLDLAGYGLYALEAAAVAAGLHVGSASKRTHWNKAELAQSLAKDYGLPQVWELMHDLNTIRKSEAYGDIASPPRLDPEDVAGRVESYVEAVASLLNPHQSRA